MERGFEKEFERFSTNKQECQGLINYQYNIWPCQFATYIYFVHFIFWGPNTFWDEFEFECIINWIGTNYRIKFKQYLAISLFATVVTAWPHLAFSWPTFSHCFVSASYFQISERFQISLFVVPGLLVPPKSGLSVTHQSHTPIPLTHHVHGVVQTRSPHTLNCCR